MSTAISAHIESTREALRQHGEARMLSRMVRRLIGRYPTKEALEALRRHDLTPAARSIENVLDAVGQTRRLNNVPAAILGGRFATSVPDREFDPSLATLPLPLNDELREATKNVLGISELPGGDSVGFWIHQYSKYDTPKRAASYTPGVGVVVMDQGKTVYSTFLTQERINGSWPEAQIGLETLTSAAASHAFLTYIEHKPEITD